MQKSYFLSTILWFLLLIVAGTTHAQAPDWQWAKASGGSNADGANTLCTDASGNIIVAGFFKSASITFGSVTLTNIGSYENMFLTKYDATGQVLWAKNLSGTKRDLATDIHVSKDGSIYLAGSFTSPEILFGATSLSNSGLDDLFIAKIGGVTAVSEANKEDWVHVYPNPASDHLYYVLNHQVSNACFEVYDMLGKQSISQGISTANGYLDLTDLVNGVYIVTIKADHSSIWTGKLAIQK